MEGRNLYSIVPIFLRDGVYFLFSHTYMHSESLGKHLHALAMLKETCFWKQPGSFPSQSRKDTQPWPLGSPRGSPGADTSTSATQNWDVQLEGGNSTIFSVNSLWRIKSWGDTNTISYNNFYSLSCYFQGDTPQSFCYLPAILANQKQVSP